MKVTIVQEKKKITDFSRIVTKKMEGKIRFQEAYYECTTKNMVGSQLRKKSSAGAVSTEPKERHENLEWLT